MTKQYTKIMGILVLTLIGSLYLLPERKVGAVLSISEQIVGKSGKERQDIISRFIENLPFAGTFISTKHGVTVEMENVRAIEGGIEVYARAWRGIKQLGFSKDGSVEWEKFRITSPPFLVQDANGGIIRDTTELRGKDIVTVQLKLKESPFEVVREELARTIKIAGKENTQIIAGKRGSTVTSVKTDEDQSTTWDGYAGRSSAGGTWAALHDGAGTACSATLGSGDFTRLGEDAGGFDSMNRGVLSFPTGANLPDGDTVDSVDFVVEGTAKTDNATHNQGVTVATSNPASDTACANADYFKDSQEVGGGTDCSADMDIGSWSTTGDNTFVLTSASSYCSISTTAITKTALLLSGDQSDTAPSSGGAGAISSVGYKHVESVGGEPRLVITHSSGAAGGEEQPIWHLFMNTLNQLAFR